MLKGAPPKTMVPLSRRVPSSTLDKLPVVLASPTSPVASAYRALADEICSTVERTSS
jgi:chromosome partitioning protein